MFICCCCCCCQFIFIIIADRSIETIISISDALACFGSLYFTRHSLFGSVVYLNEPDMCVAYAYPYLNLNHIISKHLLEIKIFGIFSYILLLYNWNVLRCRHFFIIIIFFFFFSFFSWYQFHNSGNDGDTNSMLLVFSYSVHISLSRDCARYPTIIVWILILKLLLNEDVIHLVPILISFENQFYVKY